MVLVANAQGYFETEIILQTREGNNIDNSQSHEFSPTEVGYFAFLRTKFPRSDIRTAPNPIYNCHGLTFASRRTGIFRADMLSKIINEDDGYTEINAREMLPGDIILYIDEHNEIIHSGIVLETPSPLNYNICKIISKWGRFGEVVHWANECPYNEGLVNAKYIRLTEWK